MEHTLGLEERDGKLVRLSSPLPIHEASELLAADSGLEAKRCRDYLAEFLLAAHRCRSERGLGLFAFRLHQFISGAWNVYSTLEGPGERYLTLDGQKFKPGDRDRPLWSLCFCRTCGQEYVPVWASLSGREPRAFEPRELSKRSSDEEDVQYGYFMPDPAATFDASDMDRYPEDWLEYTGGEARMKRHFRARRPRGLRVDPKGFATVDGLAAHYIPEAFRFCLNPDCDARFDGTVRNEFAKLSGLSSEGRSSATTILALSALKHLIGTDLDERTKKLLAFTDNRQGVSLQAGHFNDFVQILLLRGALLAAMRSAGGEPLTDEVLTQEGALPSAPRSLGLLGQSLGQGHQGPEHAQGAPGRARLPALLRPATRLAHQQSEARTARVAGHRIPWTDRVLRGRGGMARPASAARVDRARSPVRTRSGASGTHAEGALHQDHLSGSEPPGADAQPELQRVEGALVTVLRDAAGSVPMTLETGSLEGLEALGWSPPEMVVTNARDGVTDLYGMIVRPTGFDPDAVYPVID